jgi:enoyl-CoA hydratase
MGREVVRAVTAEPDMTAVAAVDPLHAGETVEGIRALAVDKDHAPRWNPSRIEDVAPEAVAAFFDSPWPRHAHPLRELA